MTEWWTYRPADLLLFSERTYWRLFELLNWAFWPMQYVALLLGLAMLVCILRWPGRAARPVAVLLAVLWIVAGWAFVWKLYAPINWTMRYVVWMFVIQALLLAGVGGYLKSARIGLARGYGARLGLAMAVYALAVHPLLAIVAGRPWAASEVFGLAPDPTAIATLGFLALLNGGWPVRLGAVVPLLWCLISGATLLVMGAVEAWAPLAAIPLGILAQVRTGRASGDAPRP